MLASEFRAAAEDIFQVPRGSLKDSDTRDTVQEWSSLADLQLLVLIKQEMGIEPEAELVEAETFGDLMKVLEEKGAL